MKNNIWSHALFFVLGCLVCYIGLQYTLFNIKTEMDVPGLLINVCTALTALYIAHTIQKKINRSQNQFSYVWNKIDALWSSFNTYSQILSYDTKIDVSALSKFSKEIIHPIGFIKSIFNSFNHSDTCICDLEKKLENFETLLTSIPAQNNVIDFSVQKNAVDDSILMINQSFSDILKEIQSL